LQRKKLFGLAIAGAVACVPGAFTSSAFAVSGSLTGAGSTLVAPLEAQWAQGWQSRNPGASVTYQAVGSGSGILAITQRQVDFGASDAPLSATQASACGSCVMIPWALSATGVGYHLSGVRKLKLSGPVLANIYLGNITNWNSPQIKRLNKGVNLPNLKITPLFRTDGSGDTYAFTNYLSHVSAAFRSKVGVGTSVQFPTGAGGKGNSGVTQVLESTNGSIAYIAVSYLIAHSLPAAAIQNRAGRFEYPNANNIENAAQSVKHVPGNNAISIVDPPKRQKIAYPISTFTYAIVPTQPKQASLLKSFIQYALGPGQSFGFSLDFAKVPKVVLNAAKRAAGRL
jgi:phosphate transport system substrate-binding protein